MPTVDHEAPLVVLREQPALVPALLRESLGLSLPPFETVELGDTGFTQVVSAELRADLVVQLRGAASDPDPVLGIVLEIQRARDEAKRRSWPLYLAALHARLSCAVCLVVIAPNPAVARWAARPIATFQPTSPLIPLVLGRDDFPRVSVARAQHEPWLAILSALVHSDRLDDAAELGTAIAALRRLPEEHAEVCYNLLRAALSAPARRSLEEQMQPNRFERIGQLIYDRYMEGKADGLAEGKAEGKADGLAEGEARGLAAAVLALADRHGAPAPELRRRVTVCTDATRLRDLTLELAGAADRAAVEAVLARLPPAPAA